MLVTFDALTAAVAANVVTLTLTSGTSEAHPGQFVLTGSGIVINLTANAAQMFNTTDKYRVVIQRMT
jgi:hypothetical protein